jgi:hypothetical protein
MTGTDFYYIDNKEQRFQLGHMGTYLDNILKLLALDPGSIDKLDELHKSDFGETLFEKGNLPDVPSELELKTIRLVLGMQKEDDQEVLDYWMEVNGYTRPNFCSYPLEEDLKAIPKIDEALVAEWKDSPYRSYCKSVEAYRRAQASGNGVVIVDFRDNTLSYLSSDFRIKKSEAPKSWQVVRL